MSEPAVPPGAEVGGYRLLAKIGEGGMGVVHLAQAPDGARVALKVLRPHIVGDDEARERLAREVASLRRVRSPRVAEVIDADPWAETPYVATRYVPGLSLHEHVRREGPIRDGDLRHFAHGLAEAMAAVHAVGVLHRDIKPSNVLLEGRSPVLIDFGLARLADDPRLTMTGWLLGTPGYLAPEILYGDDATPASDVHSWAATVVLAATGAPPFGRGPAMAIMDRVRRGEHDLSEVPDGLRPLLRDCLAPDPGGRPSTTDLLGALAPAAAPLAGAAAAAEPAGEQPTMPIALSDVHTPARTPYETPLPPQQTSVLTEDHSGAPAALPQHDGARLQRAALLATVLAVVGLGFAAAPYPALAAVALAVLGLRTWCAVSEAAEDRVWRRGRPAWYDAPLTVASSPFHLLVSAGGTLVLVLWAAACALLVLLGALLVTGSAPLAMLASGLVLGLALWWGPGHRRLRRPMRRLVTRAVGYERVGWVVVAVLAALAATCGLLLMFQGPAWYPQPGPPWREGTLLGGLRDFLRG